MPTTLKDRVFLACLLFVFFLMLALLPIVANAQTATPTPIPTTIHIDFRQGTLGWMPIHYASVTPCDDTPTPITYINQDWAYYGVPHEGAWNSFNTTCEGTRTASTGIIFALTLDTYITSVTIEGGSMGDGPIIAVRKWLAGSESDSDLTTLNWGHAANVPYAINQTIPTGDRLALYIINGSNAVPYDPESWITGVSISFIGQCGFGSNCPQVLPAVTVTPWSLSMTDYAADANETAGGLIVFIPIIIGISVAIFIAAFVIGQIRSIVQ